MKEVCAGVVCCVWVCGCVGVSHGCIGVEIENQTSQVKMDNIFLQKKINFFLKKYRGAAGARGHNRYIE